MRAYLRLDPNLPDRKAAYPDGAHRAYIDTLCFAEQQPQRGRFRSAKLLAVLLERRAKWIPYLLSHGDLVKTEGGLLYLDGWDEWQEGDVTVSERMKRLRSRRRDVTPTDTPAVTPPTVSVPSERLAVGGGGKPKAETGDRNNGQPSTSMMGWRPKADPDDVKRQAEEDWVKCADCDLLKRKHPVSGDHPFRPELRSVS